MSEEKQAICPECKKPCGPVKPGATKYHWNCLAKHMKEVRLEWALETDEEKIERMSYQLLVACSKCKRLVHELDDTHLCTWCASLEEEC